MYSEESGDTMVECPYDSCHRLLRKNLQKHLLKCKLNYPNVELQTCPFDKIHLVQEKDYVNHINNCPARNKIFHNELIGTNNKLKVETEEKIVKHELIECEENWDDTEVEDYNPLKTASVSVLKRRPVFSPYADSALTKKKIKSENSKNEVPYCNTSNESKRKDNLYIKEEDKPKPAGQETVGIYCFIDDRPDEYESFSTENNIEQHSSNEDRESASPPPPPPVISNYTPRQGERNRCSPSSRSYLSNSRQTNRYFGSYEDVSANTNSRLDRRQSYCQAESRRNMRTDERFAPYVNPPYNGQYSVRQERGSQSNLQLRHLDNPHCQQSTQRPFRGRYHMNSYYSSR